MKNKTDKTIIGTFTTSGLYGYAEIIGRNHEGVYMCTSEYPYLMDGLCFTINGRPYNIDMWKLKVSGRYLPQVNLIIPDEIVLVDENGNEHGMLEKVQKKEEICESPEEYFFNNLADSEYIKENEDIIDAYRNINHVIRSAPGNEDAWLFKGIILKNSRIARDINIQDALQCLEKVLTMNPENERALMGIAEIHYWMKDTEKIIGTCDRILDINPNNYKGWFWKGFGFFYKNQYKKALDAMNDALDVLNEAIDAMNSGFKNRSSYEAWRDKWKIDDWTIDDLKIEAWMQKARLLALCGRFPEAFEHIEKARKIDTPYNNDYHPTHIWSLKAEVYREMGEYEKAIEYHDRCIGIAPYLENFRIEKAITFERKQICSAFR